MSSSTFRLWAKRIEGGQATKAQCVRFANVAARLAGHLEVFGRTNLTTEEAERLYDMVQASPLRLSPEENAKGLAWLRRYARRALGAEFPLDRVLEGFSHFEYAGESAPMTTWGSTVVWRIVLDDGSILAYYKASWQMVQYAALGPANDHAGWWWVSNLQRKAAA